MILLLPAEKSASALEASLTLARHLSDAGHPARVDDEVLGAEDHPVVGVTWLDADRFCKWLGRSLPTEAPWEAAAPGSRARVGRTGRTTRHAASDRRSRVGRRTPSS